LLAFVPPSFNISLNLSDLNTSKSWKRLNLIAQYVAYYQIAHMIDYLPIV